MVRKPVSYGVAGPEPRPVPPSGAIGSTSRPNQAAVSCRRIVVGDRDRLVALLARSFPLRDVAYWELGVDRLVRHAADQGYPHFGYVLTAGADLVGALLMIFRYIPADGHTRCNLSSWCVDERYRSYGSLLVTMATRDKSVTYINISPERKTRKTVEAQGFTRYVDGLFMAVPLLSRSRKETVTGLSEQGCVPATATADDVALMKAHASLDCLTLWCVAPDGAYPFVFVRSKRFRNLVNSAHVVYCSDLSLVGRFAKVIGLFLARHRIFILSMDANGPVEGLHGRHLADRMPKYFRGDHKPRLGDLAYTELPLFGA